MKVKHLSLIALIITFFLLILGGIVHNTQSSLACPDWPLCYGQIFPKMEGGILIEHSHRLLASFVGLLTIGVVFLASKEKRISEKHHHIFKISLLALFFVVAQGLLGGITVIFRLPTIVSTAHLGLSMIFFSTMIYINHKSRTANHNHLVHNLSIEIKDKIQKTWRPFIRHGIVFALVLVYLQILLGAFMRHSGAGASCGLGFSQSFLCLDVQGWIYTLWPSLPEARLHMAHRIFAFIAFFAVLIFCFKASLFFKNERKIKYLAIAPIIVLILQIFLGILTVALNISILPTTLHLALAALSLASLWKLNLILFDLESFFFLGSRHSLLSDLVDLAKPRLALLVMATVLVGALFAPLHVHFFHGLFSFVLIAMVVVGGTTLNCYLERDVDALMTRTKDRPLASKRMKPQLALFLGIILLIISIPMLAYFVNITTSLLAALAAFAYIFAYTPMKLKSELAVYIGAIPGAIPPVLGYTTVMAKVDGMAMTLFFILFIWQLPHFMAISIYLADDYDAASIKVYPNQKGLFLTKMAIFVLTLALFAVSLIPTYVYAASMLYRNVAIVLGILFILFSLRSFFLDSSLAAQKVWAKNYFYGSLFYLPLLLSALIFFK